MPAESTLPPPTPNAPSAPTALRLTALFLYPLASALLVATASRIYAQWTGGFTSWFAIIPPLLIGACVAWLCARKTRRWAGERTCLGVALLVAILAFMAFGNTAQVVKEWTLLSLRIGLDYNAWHAFVARKAIFWLAPSMFLLPFLWLNNGVERGKLTVFFGFCSGLILARIGIGRIPTRWILDVSLLAMLMLPLLWGFSAYRRIWTKCALALLMLMLGAGWYFGSFRSARELLTEVNPFAPIAARDNLYTGEGTEGVTLREGRVLRVARIDRASRTASQLIPVLLKPNASARIAVRPQADDPLLPTFETGQLKGLYDALWVELPPAWMPDERDYFGGGALEAALTHLQPEGVLVYDMDAHALNARMVMERIGILKVRFPYVQIWVTGRNMWQLVASRKPITADLEQISALNDRAPIAQALLRANIDSPVTLLACCLSAQAQTLEERLVEPIAPKVRWQEAREARKLLFDGIGSQRLEEAFAPQMDSEMPWVKLPPALADSLKPTLALLREARALLFKGKYKEASQIAPCDPYLLGLADREISTAHAWEQLAEHEKALASYASAFVLAQPAMADVLDAASIAQRTAKPERAEVFYQFAEVLNPSDPKYLWQYVYYLLDHNRPADALPFAERGVEGADDPEERTLWQFCVAQCLTLQPKTKQEGLQRARAIAKSASTKFERDIYIPAYAKLLIETGDFVNGIRVKRHFQAYDELLEEPTPPSIRKVQKK